MTLAPYHSTRLYLQNNCKIISQKAGIYSTESDSEAPSWFCKKNCKIYFNIHKTAEVIAFLNKNKLPEVIAMIYFEKFFNGVKYDSIRGVFQYFGFGDKFLLTLFLLFTDLEIATSEQWVPV